MTGRLIGPASALAAALALFAPATADAQARCYGAEDGYDDDEFGWGPAYRCETTFRPAIGFYGGIERPYPYGRNPSVNPVTRNGVTYGYNPNYPGGIGPIAPRVRAPVVVERRVVRKRSAKAGRRVVVR